MPELLERRAERGARARNAAARTIFALGLAACLVVACRSPGTADAASADPTTLLDRARAAESRGDYGETRDLCRRVVDAVPESDFAAEAAFLAAEADLLAGNTRRALNAFKEYVQTYRFSAYLGRVEERIFEIGKRYLDGELRSFFGLFSNRGRGVSAFEFLLENFPRGRRAAEAQRLLGAYYFEREKYEDALREYRDLIERFPESEWVPLAHFRIGMCYIRQSRGPVYDVSLLQRARDSFQRYADLYPEGTLFEDARASIATIDESLAESCYRIGRYYERNRDPVAAKLYYRKVLETYPESGWSAGAEAGIARLGGRKEEE